MKRRYFKTVLVQYLEKKYDIKITEKAVNAGVILEGVGLIPKAKLIFEEVNNGSIFNTSTNQLSEYHRP